MSQKILIFILIVVSIGTSIEIEMLSPSFVSMSKFFNASPELMGWIVTSNVTGFFLGALFVGALSDTYGRKKTIIYGNLVLFIGAIGCAISSDIYHLIAWRFIQGLGASTGVVLVPMIIADVFQNDKAEKFYRILGSVCTVFMSGSPVIGGIVNDYIGWRANIYIIVVIELIAWLSVFVLFKETKKDEYRKFNVKRIFTDFRDVLIHKPFLMALAVLTPLNGIYFIFITYGIFIYVETFKQTAMVFSICLLIFVVTYSILCAVTINVKTTRKLLYFGGVLNFLAFILMLFSQSIYWMTFCITIHGIACIYLYPQMSAYCMTLLPNHKSASSSSMTLLRNIVISLSVWASGLFFTGSVFSFTIPMIVLSIIVLLGVFYISEFTNCVVKKDIV